MPRDRRRRRHRHCRRHPGASIRRPSTAPAQRDARLSRDAQRRGEGGDMQQHVGRLVPELYLLGLTRTPVKRTRRRRRRRTQRRRDEVFQWAVDRGGVSREGPRTCHASGRSLYLTGRSLRRPKLPPFNLPTFAPPSVHVRSRTLRSLHTASQNTRPASCHRRHVLFSFPCAGDCQGPVERAGRVRVSRSHPQPMTAVCCAARAVLQRCNKHLVPLTLTRPLST